MLKWIVSNTCTCAGSVAVACSCIYFLENTAKEHAMEDAPFIFLLIGGVILFIAGMGFDE